MGVTTSVEIEYKFADGWHIFVARDMPGLYVADRDLKQAYATVGPAIERLIELDSNVVCRAIPVVPFGEFVGRRPVTNTQAQRFTLLKEAA